MSEYTVWEEAIIELVAEALDASRSDAAGVVEAQPFYMQQSWGKGMDAKETAEKILAEVRQ
ncbi:hypothetical protein [Pseudomonas sp. UMAB-40]|uniref:hypothetical protein n=1 Tax=Pseudomonas sp. UMAB-40 TaxID=1365407 RepID=UPI001C563C49|nr:hypothetical protein [Pseudomonas sp. UMAB-40]